jgi:hypothetical protein
LEELNKGMDHAGKPLILEFRVEFAEDAGDEGKLFVIAMLW